jgi:hypothetical protein
MFKISLSLILFLFGICSACVEEISSLEKIICDSKVILKANLIDLSKVTKINENWYYYDMYLKVDSVYKGNNIPPKIKVRIYGNMYNEWDIINIQTIINKNDKRLFYCFLNDTNYGQGYCNKYFSIKNDYDYVPTEYMSPISIFDFGKYDNSCYNVIMDSNLNEISASEIDKFLFNKLNEYSKGNRQFARIKLNQKVINRINNIKRVNEACESCEEWIFFVDIEAYYECK